jgi:hypothetical protein
MAGRKRGGGPCGTGESPPGKARGARGKKPAAVRGRPPRLAHLVPGSVRNARRERALAAMLGGSPLREPAVEHGARESPVAGDGAASLAADVLCLPNPEWLPHLLTVAGPAACVTAFRAAARGPGCVAWRCDYGQLAEDWFHQLLAPHPAARGISVPGARIAAGQMRALVETLETQAVDCADPARCPLDLNALVPIPDALLRLGPEDPAVLAWLWANWGTTWMLRDVTAAPVGDAAVLLPAGHTAVSYRFWSADWTPWRALAAVRRRWPLLVLTVSVRGIAE